MGAGWYSGVIVAPPILAGWGAGLYADNYGNVYVQGYYGTPRTEALPILQDATLIWHR